jgi:NADPH-dependent curcumin reductase
MQSARNRRIVLAARPKGEPQETDFRLEDAEIPSPGDGEVLLRTLYLSLDPYMRGRMNAARSYAAPVEIGDVMEGGTVSEVIESQVADVHPGDIVLSHCGWQEYAVAQAKGLRKLDTGAAPISAALGVLGMPGFTAYTGLLNIGQPKAGETVVVAAAAGAVGSVVGQMAKISGCRAIGIAGGPEKCDHVRNDLGFDECLDHRAGGLKAELKRACPNGIDVYFENVGGAVFDAVFPLLNPFARVPVCGLIAHYNATGLPEGPDRTPFLMSAILIKRLTFRGFIVTDFVSQYSDFIRDMSGWISEGKVRYREHVVDGLENAVAAFQGLLRGRNTGKMLVRVASQ